ncbi:MAG: copper homeostasis protein CutC [Microlunatus sp.]|nr:copper homeostasis protein CutC [Microlunatus sp.]MDN5770044.1 copper homeostasis protein CutC [Microlunatus sp.]MDN5804399.1 copper homeostasis protein CutC [Microlunatus sp.]
MSGLLEVIALHAHDAERAEAGGADRIELVGSMVAGGMSPEPALVGQARRATRLPIRVMLRLREGFGTDGGEVTRLQGLLSAYRSVGADGVVLGFLNGHTEIDDGVVLEILGGEPDFGWTFHRAVDSCMSTDKAWRVLRLLPGLDQVLTAGSARGVAEGLDDLVARAHADEFARRMIIAGGGLLPEHVPWLARAGIRSFHIGSPARPLGSWKAYLDPDLVRTWRTLIDDAVGRADGSAASS